LNAFLQFFAASLVAFECGDLPQTAVFDNLQDETQGTLYKAEHRRSNGTICCTITAEYSDSQITLYVHDQDHGLAAYMIVHRDEWGIESRREHYDGAGRLLFYVILAEGSEWAYYRPDGTPTTYCELGPVMAPIHSKQDFDNECA